MDSGLQASGLGIPYIGTTFRAKYILFGDMDPQGWMLGRLSVLECSKPYKFLI